MESTTRILAVDDSATIRKALQLILEPAGYQETEIRVFLTQRGPRTRQLDHTLVTHDAADKACDNGFPRDAQCVADRLTLGFGTLRIVAFVRVDPVAAPASENLDFPSGT